MNYDYRADWTPNRYRGGANLPRRPSHTPFRMSPSRALPFPDRAREPEPFKGRGWVDRAQSHFTVDTAKCARRKTMTAYAKCLAQATTKQAKANWAKCQRAGKTLNVKGLGRNKKKALKREVVTKCLRTGK